MITRQVLRYLFCFADKQCTCFAGERNGWKDRSIDSRTRSTPISDKRSTRTSHDEVSMVVDAALRWSMKPMIALDLSDGDALSFTENFPTLLAPSSSTIKVEHGFFYMLPENVRGRSRDLNQASDRNLGV